MATLAPVAPIPVIGAEWIAKQPVELKLKEKVFSLSGDGFKITDNVSGQVFFSLKPKLLSLSGKKTISSANGASPVFILSEKLMSVHSTQKISSPSGELICSLKRKKFLQISSDMHVFLNDGDTDPDYNIKGDWRAKKFEISRISDGAIVAYIKREGGLNARNLLAEVDTYFIQVPTGGDMAFALAIAIAADEIYRDQEQGR